MNRKDEYLLNEEVKSLLKEKGIEDEEAVIIGYRLGHKYIDNDIEGALPTIIEKIVEAKNSDQPIKYRTVSSAVHKAIPIRKKETTTKEKDPFDSMYTHKPFEDLLKDYKK
jgi:hypothetical protein